MEGLKQGQCKRDLVRLHAHGSLEAAEDLTKEAEFKLESMHVYWWADIPATGYFLVHAALVHRRALRCGADPDSNSLNWRAEEDDEPGPRIAELSRCVAVGSCGCR